MLQHLLAILGVLLTSIGIPLLYLQLKGLKLSIRTSTHAAIYGHAEALRGYLRAQTAEFISETIGSQL